MPCASVTEMLLPAGPVMRTLTPAAGSFDSLTPLCTIPIKRPPDRDQPWKLRGPTNTILAVKSMFAGTPCSVNIGRPPQSPIGGHQGKKKDEKAATITSTQNNPA